MLDESKSSLLLFDIVSTTFISGKISSKKGVKGPLPNLGRFTVISLTIFGSYYVNVSGMPMVFFKSYMYGKYRTYRTVCPITYLNLN